MKNNKGKRQKNKCNQNLIKITHFLKFVLGLNTKFILAITKTGENLRPRENYQKKHLLSVTRLESNVQHISSADDCGALIWLNYCIRVN